MFHLFCWLSIDFVVDVAYQYHYCQTLKSASKEIRGIRKFGSTLLTIELVGTSLWNVLLGGEDFGIFRESKLENVL